MRQKKQRLWVVLTVLLSLVLTIGAPAFAIGESGTTGIGWGTTFYITKDGTVWGYGKNAEDLIPGGDAYVEEPVQIMSDAKSVCANRYAVVVVKRDGSLWYWGRIGGLKKVAQPTKLMENVAAVAVEAYYASVMLVANNDGELFELVDGEFQRVLHHKKVKFVATGGSTKFFINEEDELWGWSANKNGENSGALGVGHSEPVLEPVKIMEDVQAVASYTSNTLFLRKDSTLWASGNGVSGKLYTADGVIDGPALSPLKVMDHVLHMAVYDSRFAAVTRDNALWVWGNSPLNASTEPVKVATNVLYATIGSHLAVIKTDNTLWTGGNKDGVYRAEKSSKNDFRLTAQGLQDAPAAWALAEVREAEYRKLVPPTMQSDYTKIVTRSEFCTLAIICIEQIKQMTIEEYLVAEGITLPESLPFMDIAGLNERGRKDIAAAYALKIVNGTSATTFDPGNQITREQAAKMLTATAAALGKETSAMVPAFSDSERIAGWAKPFIGYVFDAKIMSGVGGNRFDPQGGYQRQQAYMTMLRLFKLLTE